MNTGARNLAWADRLIAALAAAGVRDAVLAPGARSAPLALAALRRPELACQVINDERAAGFFALGLGKASGRPALVVTTSGTAAANLLPAVMEANLAAVPLIVLTADRPAEIHGWGANQTVDQTKLFGEHVRAFHALPPPDEAIEARFFAAFAARLIETASFPVAGPVHVNVPFAEPLLPETIPAPSPLPAAVAVQAPPAAVPQGLAAIAARLTSRPGVIVCGEAHYPDGFADTVARLGIALDAPVIAEALANLRFGPHDKSHFVAHAARFLRDTDLPRPAWVLRFGAFPVSRTIERWLNSLRACEKIRRERADGKAPGAQRPRHNIELGEGAKTEFRRRLTSAQPRLSEAAEANTAQRSQRAAQQNFSQALADAEHFLVAPPARWPDPLWQSSTWLRGEPLAIASALASMCRPASADFSTQWLAAEAAARAMTDTRFFEGTIARELLRRLPAGSQVFVGNSLAIRAVDAFGGLGETPLTLYGNRGASGIDGNLATAAGIAQASQAPTVALIGDQTLLHDATSLALAARHGVTVVLLNNGGGGIFDHLPFAPALPAELLERGWRAPQGGDFAALAAAFRLEHRRVTSLEALAEALTPLPRACLIEAVIDPATSRAGFSSPANAHAGNRHPRRMKYHDHAQK
ncbi:2-succinyl-5-enolpyruvyl-6-hydroxy-3-cyclohexene-1-carboxylic-acid synthase [Sulfuricystis thermophila]|uniref:2-succinyl-5-enolpyruvyl-6-hydroxy-3- cyclohexene-1-carboxylic-acid synthase n=1 Tax=Sulfuricystis thermophila TaxID=2496847 RepID=UPI00103623C3|nr:2-succinyl-5-enolpyruvyl-6-hydroxy-3-cyclohexene-1-carboxylic-acid synthase [Sulfuricystis thermophila]